MLRDRPPVGVQLNRTHPLCPDLFCALFNEGSGSRTYDRIYQRRGVLSGGAWRAGKYGIVREQTTITDSIDFGNAYWVRTPITIVLGYRKVDAVARQTDAVGTTDTGGGQRLNVHLPFSDGIVYWDAGNASSGRVSYSGATFGDDIWAFTSGARGTEIWQNGKLVASQTGWVSYTPTSGAAFRLGSTVAGFADFAQYSFCYVYGSQISPGAIRQLAAAPFGMFHDRTPQNRWFRLGVSVTGSSTVGLVLGSAVNGSIGHPGRTSCDVALGCTSGSTIDNLPTSTCGIRLGATVDRPAIGHAGASNCTVALGGSVWGTQGFGWTFESTGVPCDMVLGIPVIVALSASRIRCITGQEELSRGRPRIKFSY